jgi:ribosomal protein L37AE/L43A
MIDAMEDRPLCPICHNPKPISNGPKWLCKVCGKQWMKHSAASRNQAFLGKPYSEAALVTEEAWNNLGQKRNNITVVKVKIT